MNYTEEDLRRFLYLFRAYGTKPYINRIYMYPDDITGAFVKPDEHNVGSVLMSCIAYYLHLDLSDDQIVANFIQVRDDLSSIPVGSYYNASFKIIMDMMMLVENEKLEEHHATNVLKQLVEMTRRKGFEFDFSSMFRTGIGHTMVSLAVHTPSRLQYHPQVREICKGISHICKTSNDEGLAYGEGKRIVEEMIEEITFIKTNGSNIEASKFRLNDMLKKILRLYGRRPDSDILRLSLLKMYPDRQKFSSTYAGMTDVVLLNLFIHCLEKTKKSTDAIYNHPHLVHEILSYFDALCNRVRLDVFEAIIEDIDLYYSDLEEGWII